MEFDRKHQFGINLQDVPLSYPEDAIANIKEIIEAGGNVHIHGKNGAGKSTLLRLLALEFSKKKHVIFIPQRYDVEDTHEDLPLATFLPPGLDYWKILQKKNPEVVIVDGDNSLQARNGKQFPSGEPVEEEFLPYQHAHTLWSMTNKHIQVLSAGEQSVLEMNTHLKEYGMGAYGMNYELDVEIMKKPGKDGEVLFDLKVENVEYIRIQKIQGMRSLLQSISKERS